MTLSTLLFSPRTALNVTTSKETALALPYRRLPATHPQQQSQSSPQPGTATGPAAASTGTKRSRPSSTRMTPSCPYLRRVRRRRNANSSEYPSGDNIGDSDSDSDKHSCCEEDDCPDEDFVLPEEHRFQQARQPLLRLARRMVDAFGADVQYVAPPDHQPPLRKRHRRLQNSACPLNKSDDDGDQRDTDEGFVVVSSPQETSEESREEFLHFSCPFYKLDPKKHRQCLLQHDLRTMNKVIKHLQCHHKKPPYCPICSQTFDTVPICDRHILKRACKTSNLIIPEGIDYSQRAELTKRDRQHLTNIERWRCVNDTVFPGVVSVPSPFLDQGCGREVSLARDYWGKYGWGCMSDFLASQDLLDKNEDNDERARMSLFKLTLEDLLVEIMREYEHGKRQ
ncbi:hypothetical protein FDECE_16941 [Fusarium decemcellulare]|nr:hypothetical protein FDECE_16941 [Fusarium decemcellulare]